MEEGKKVKSNLGLIVIVVILLIAVFGLCGYIILNKDNSNSTKYVAGSDNNNTNAKNEVSQKNTETTTSTKETKANSTITFDGSNQLIVMAKTTL